MPCRVTGFFTMGTFGWTSKQVGIPYRWWDFSGSGKCRFNPCGDAAVWTKKICITGWCCIASDYFYSPCHAGDGCIYFIAVLSPAVSACPPYKVSSLHRCLPMNRVNWGALTSLMSLTAILSPPLIDQYVCIFSGTKAPIVFPGAAFYWAAYLWCQSGAGTGGIAPSRFCGRKGASTKYKSGNPEWSLEIFVIFFECFFYFGILCIAGGLSADLQWYDQFLQREINRHELIHALHPYNLNNLQCRYNPVISESQIMISSSINR